MAIRASSVRTPASAVLLWMAGGAGAGCESGDVPNTSVCPVERRISGSLAGALLSAPNPRVAAVDASNWRFGDAPVMSDVVAPDPNTGRFELCLHEAPITERPFEKAFLAAWNDLDGDARFDQKDEALCDDAAASGSAFAYLYYTPTGTIGWTLGDSRVTPDATFNPVLDGDACEP